MSPSIILLAAIVLGIAGLVTISIALLQVLQLLQAVSRSGKERYTAKGPVLVRVPVEGSNDTSNRAN